MYKYKILAINPGSTSVKLAAFEMDQELFKVNVPIDPDKMAKMDFWEQSVYLKQMIEKNLGERGMDPYGFDAYVGRGGAMVPCEGGVYQVNDRLLEDASSGKYAGKHPSRLGSTLAYEFAKPGRRPSFIVNGPDTDEFCDEARITGLSGVYRESRIHALNQKEVAWRVSKELNMEYKDSRLIVAHLGGGISVTAHCGGRMIDSNDILSGDGPMAPTRSGALPARHLLDMVYSGKYSKEELYDKIHATGGLQDHLGTSDVRKVKEMAESGDAYAKLIYSAFIHQIAKQIGSMAVVLNGNIDAIVLTGGIAFDEELVGRLKEKVGFLGNVIVRPGEFEMEALAAGVLRALRGEVEIKEYTGVSVFRGFDKLKKRQRG